MIHKSWEQTKSDRYVTCIENVAKKFKVNSMLTVGKQYKVVNETDEFIFIIDNSHRVGGYYKTYFQ